MVGSSVPYLGCDDREIREKGKLRVRKNGSKGKQHSGWGEGEGHRGDDGKVPRIKGKSHAYLGEYAVVQGGELPTRR